MPSDRALRAANITGAPLEVKAATKAVPAGWDPEAFDATLLLLAELYCQGIPPHEICSSKGLSPQEWKQYSHHPTFLTAVEDIKGEIIARARASLTMQVTHSIDKIVTLRDNSLSERIALDASKDLLDRGGLKAIDRVEQVTEVTLSPDLLILMEACIKELHTVKAVTVIETSALPERGLP